MYFFQFLKHVYLQTYITYPCVIYDLWNNFILQSCIISRSFYYYIRWYIKFLLYTFCCWNLSGWIHPKKNCRNDFWYAWLTPPTSVSTFLRPKNGQAEWWLVLNRKIEFSCLFKTSDSNTFVYFSVANNWTLDWTNLYVVLHIWFWLQIMKLVVSK